MLAALRHLFGKVAGHHRRTDAANQRQMTGWDKERQGTIPEPHAQRMGIGLSGHHPT